MYCMARINVTKSFMPPAGEYKEYVDKIWLNGQITNQGPLVRDFEDKVRHYLNVDNFHFVTNGTIALQIALRSLDLTEGEIITTPFSYVATTSAILWERCTPVFVDINPTTFCIDADKIEASVTNKTKAILAVHVFGNPCEIEKIEKIASKYKLKVIYDGAHAFGVTYRGSSLLDNGDISTCSFHATKLLHTIEGGAVIAKSKQISERIELIKRFGHNYDDHITLGINGKVSEFHAAMGLCNMKYIDEIIQEREDLAHYYDFLLENKFGVPYRGGDETKSNYSYYPVVFETENKLLHCLEKLALLDIYPRRYFYPSLNKLPYITNAADCPVAQSISTRIACMPLYPGLSRKVIKTISGVILE